MRRYNTRQAKDHKRRARCLTNGHIRARHIQARRAHGRQADLGEGINEYGAEVAVTPHYLRCKLYSCFEKVAVAYKP